MPEDSRQPYIGPRPFGRKDKEFFFGRDQETNDLVSLITAHQVVLLYAQSGAGKTSLLKASLIPSLEEEDFEVLPPARVQGYDTKNNKDIKNIYVFNSLRDLSQTEDPAPKRGWRALTALLNRPARNELTLSRFLEQRARVNGSEQAGTKKGEPQFRALIFDQFEELFTLYAERYEDRKGFFEQVRDALKADPLLRVVFAMREDYIAELDPYKSILPENIQTRYRLERLRGDNALVAVKCPLDAEAVDRKREFEPGVAEKLVDNLRTMRIKSQPRNKEMLGEFVDPLQLQVVCQSLWQKLDASDHKITQAHIESFGNVDEALLDFYEGCIEKAIAAANEEKSNRAARGLTEGALRSWFERALITREDTRGLVYRARKNSDAEIIPDAAIKELVEQRLIKEEVRDGQTWYELSHDRFVQPIRESNRKWLLKQPVEEIKKEELEAKASEWIKSGRSGSLLLGETELREAKRWVKAQEAAGAQYSDVVFSYIQASRVAHEQRQTRRMQFLSVGSVIVAVLVAGLAIFAFQQKAEADTQRTQVEAKNKEIEQTSNDLEAALRATRLAQRKAEGALKAATRARENEALARKKAESAYAKTQAAMAEEAEQRKIAVEAAKTADEKTKEAERVGEDLRVALDAAKDANKKTEDALKAAEEQRLEATRQREIAENEREVTLARMLGTQAQSAADLRGDLLQRASMLAMESLRRAPSLEADSTLREGLKLLPHHKYQMRHEARVNDVAFSPDGKYIATAGWDNTARVWDGAGKEISSVTVKARINHVAFSPDGKYIATIGADNTAALWEISSRNLIRSFRHNDQINEMSISPDGQFLVTASDDRTARLWSIKTGQEVARMEHDHEVDAVAFSPNSMYIATASGGHSAHVWNLKGKQIERVEHDDRISTVAFSSDSRYLATGGWDNKARVWDFVEGQQLVAVTHESAVNDVAFSPDGNYLATAGEDRRVKVWDIKANSEKAHFLHQGTVYQVSFDSTSKYVLTASEDRTARVWAVEKGDEVARMPHTDKVYRAVFRPGGEEGGTYIATASEDRTARLWELDRSQQVLDKQLSDLAGVGVAFSPDGTSIATAAGDAAVLLDSAGKEIKRFKHEGSVLSVSFSRDGNRLATAGTDMTARIWDIRNGEQLSVMRHESVVRGVAFSFDGRYIATACPNGTAYVWDASTGNNVSSLKHGGELTSVAFSPDGKYLVSAGSDRTAKIWNTADGEMVRSLQHDGPVLKASFSPDGKLIVSASQDKTARIWDVSTGNEQTRMLGESAVNAALFSPDGKYIATANQDKTARLWEVSTSREVSRLIHNDAVWSVDFKPDGQYLATANNFGVRIWLLFQENLERLVIPETCSRLTRNLSEEEWEQYFGKREPYKKLCPNLPNE